MSRLIAPFVRLVVSAVLISVISVSGSAQITLREALDFDGDGRADFSVFRRETGTWYVNGTTGLFIGQQWGIADEDRLVPGDYNGDNRGDLAVWRDQTGEWHVLTSNDFTYTGTQWGVPGDEPVARDYDGDGRTDFAIIRRSGGLMHWWVLKSSGGYFSGQWGLESDFAVPGDFDGDGFFDFAVQRGGPDQFSPANFYILGTSEGFMAIQWGFSSDHVVPGDYDGDGRTDIAIVRGGESFYDNLVWAVHRSDGQGYIIEQFGWTGDDYTAQGDYDGDGRTDIAVWRQSNGTFYYFSSLNGSIGGSQWGAAGDLPVAAYDQH